MRYLIAFLLAFGASGATGCFPVKNSRIMGSDLALADSRFSAIPAGLIVGFTPPPGSTHTWRGAELGRLARANGFSVDQARDICFEYPERTFTEQVVLSALRRSLPAFANVQLLSFTKDPLPEGDLIFPSDGLDDRPAAAGGQTWRGYVQYLGNKRTPVTASVKVSVSVATVVATADLPADVSIPAGSVHVVTAETFNLARFTRSPVATRLEDVVGRAVRFPVRAGSVIEVADLTDPPAVRRGDSIRVEVRSGPARLRFETVAESSARLGQVMELRNPLNGKSFRARLESPSVAVVVVPGAGL